MHLHGFDLLIRNQILILTDGQCGSVNVTKAEWYDAKWKDNGLASPFAQTPQPTAFRIQEKAGERVFFMYRVSSAFIQV